MPRMLIAGVLALVLGACSLGLGSGDVGEAAGGDPEVAAHMVDRWFELARSGQEDFGWWLLHPQARSDVVASVDAYRNAFADVAWSGFDDELGGGRLHDGRYKIDVRVAGGRANVPEPICRWGLLQFAPVDGEPFEIGVMTVRIPPFGGESGILGGGAC